MKSPHRFLCFLWKRNEVEGKFTQKKPFTKLLNPSSLYSNGGFELKGYRARGEEIYTK